MMIIIQGQANSERETWFNLVLSGSIWFCLVQYGSVWFNMVQYGSVWFNMVQYGSIWFCLVQYGSIHLLVKLNHQISRTLNQPSAHTTEKSFTHLLTTQVEHVTVLIKQSVCYKKNAGVKIQADISQENFKTNIYHGISEAKF